MMNDECSLMKDSFSSFIIHHSSFIIHHSSFIIHHSSFIIHHSSFIVPTHSPLVSAGRGSGRRARTGRPASVLDAPAAFEGVPSAAMFASVAAGLGSTATRFSSFQ